ncbi:tetratricopeptide repeat protein [Hydrogenophaga sp.]|jgi:TPR repeat protein|uniref:tetratricopeptide repeat protein n=1 Tax=Hydrogenophaga sp. TaxID=1904254 RepID=UPI00271E7254|nr:tetratricopeptide repeat protein [Hydrogenophaga sp.]MDO9251881.1 tetratricopeptide repeat protein [Hydrogenophaga sp.]MDP3322717.1 tetratricopeptide repeat protein [Hydrogenophaga sp.]MDP3885192.1 tetratricopeptide repeat protein [Hydrogenophaga sp.]
MKRLLLPLLLASSAVFAQDAVPTVRICDSSGCSDRPRDSATFQPEATDPVAEQRLLQLTEIARDDPRAAYDLGLRYFRGDGVPKDSYLAIKWMREAGERGVVPAQLALGRFYLMGLEEMGPDPAEAESWLSMAAAKGNKEAQKLLPQARAAKKDEKRAYEWREAQHKTWYGGWNGAYPYYGYWGPNGWKYR